LTPPDHRAILPARNAKGGGHMPVIRDATLSRLREESEWARDQERWHAIRRRLETLYSFSGISDQERRRYVRRCLTEAEGLLDLADDVLRRSGLHQRALHPHSPPAR
jgi:hypothetical protein